MYEPFQDLLSVSEAAIWRRANWDASRLKGRAARQSNRSLQRPQMHDDPRAVAAEGFDWMGIVKQTTAVLSQLSP